MGEEPGIMVAVRRLPSLMLIAVATALWLTACHSSSGVSFDQATLSIRTSAGPVTMTVEVADSEPERERGLMGRRRLAPDADMAFLFERPTETGFWMKDTLIPLDIAYWTRGGRIVSVLHMRPCRADPCPVYPPGTSYVGAVEANWGFFDRRGIGVGDRVRLVAPRT